MCLIVLAWNPVADYRLVLAANRDEYLSRPTARLGFHDDAGRVLCGRDLEKGGTWLGITRGGRFAAVTNFRGPSGAPAGRRSRGQVVSGYLDSDEAPGAFLERLRNDRTRCAGFSLFAGNLQELWYYHSPRDRLERLGDGLYGLSNHDLDTPWPKIARAKTALGNLIAAGPIHADSVLEILSDTSQPPDQQLPDTGIGLALERALAPVFVNTGRYGTRSSTLLTVRRDGKVTMIERTHQPPAYPDRRFEFHIDQGGQ